MNNTITLTATDDNAGERLDVFLHNTLTEMSRTAAGRLADSDCVIVNGRPEKKSYLLNSGDEITVDLPAPIEANIAAEDIPLEIMYEDAELLVINKPKGVVVHPAAGNYSGTIVNALMHYCPEELSGINGVMRPGIVHRIDKDTSGVIVVAKTNSAHVKLTEQLSEHSMKRVYIGVALYNMKQDEYVIDKPIGRSPSNRKKMAVAERPGTGRRAVTHIKVLQRLDGCTLFEAALETGRTHQIRVHMASIGHPLLGDYVYGPAKQTVKVHGQALHAKVLGFIHPATGEYMEFEAPLPEYFVKLLKTFGVD